LINYLRDNKDIFPLYDECASNFSDVKPHPKEASYNLPEPSGKFQEISGKGSSGNDTSKVKVRVKDKVKVKEEVKEVTPTLEKIGSHFKATQEQIQDLISQDGEPEFKTRVQTINDYCAATGKTYKDYPAAYRNFRKRDADQLRAVKTGPPRYESRAEKNQRILRENHEKFSKMEQPQTSVFFLTETEK
jgi:hypothetical protein